MPSTIKNTGSIRGVWHYVLGTAAGAFGIYFSLSDNVAASMSKGFVPPFWQPLIGLLVVAGGTLLIRDAWKPLRIAVVVSGYCFFGIALFFIWQARI